ncbi:DUF3794 and LysM peptidoglycan-binding domain-containing protein [Acetohalobium arabaticum]|uniref:Peptidoglycan-binding lysin domain protein n=1 Tax=Acetohalobium arabaticum (strain ATCC 49924 / DSM 5501 / Z-7288) TaxID=574087 RepID=D9QSU1_ACEAZ|nr:SPOCS domain-containing protein [Acetohalobium arabaticum]ADL11629.1 Peptidoglycan-binding lysin domain protein [Acetohalobium arabaticum DSM 5501]
MAVQCRDRTVRVEYVVDEDTVRESVSGELTVPDEKPDIERVLEVTTEISTETATVEEGGVDLDIELEVGVLYVADVPEDDPQQPVHFFEGPVSVSNFVELPNAEPGMHVITDVQIIRTSSDFIDERTIEVTATLRKFAKVVEFRQMTIVTDITGLEHGLIDKELLRLNDVIDENVITEVVAGEIDVPEEKPPIERILRVQGDLIGEPETTVVDGAVIVEGTIEGGVVYVAATDEGDQPVHFFEGTFTFSYAVDVPEVSEADDLSVFTDVTVRQITASFVDDGTTGFDIVLEIFTKVTEPIQIEAVVDVDSDKIEVEKELLRVEEVIGENTITETITGNVNVPAGKPDVERILAGTNATVLNPTATVQDGGVLIDGEIEGAVIYVADVPEDELQQPVHFVENFFNFSNFVDVSGAEEGMTAYANVSVVNVRYSLLNQRTVELTTTLQKFAKVVQFRQLEIVTDCIAVSPIVDEPCEDRPSYVVYVVQPGDTLYKIARRYGTTIDAIVEANDIPDPDRIDVGQKLCIPKKIIDPKG